MIPILIVINEKKERTPLTWRSFYGFLMVDYVSFYRTLISSIENKKKFNYFSIGHNNKEE